MARKESRQASSGDERGRRARKRQTGIDKQEREADSRQQRVRKKNVKRTSQPHDTFIPGRRRCHDSLPR